jgi:hypothetical protein
MEIFAGARASHRAASERAMRELKVLASRKMRFRKEHIAVICEYYRDCPDWWNQLWKIKFSQEKFRYRYSNISDPSPPCRAVFVNWTKKLLAGVPLKSFGTRIISLRN